MALEDGFEPTTRTPSTCRSTSELLQRMDPTPGIEPGRGGSADRRLPIWQGRVVVWHQGKDLNPHPVVQSHVSYRLDHPGVWCVSPSTGIEPALNCSTGSRPHQRTARA